MPRAWPLLLLLAGCAGPEAFTPAAIDALIPGRSLYQTVKSGGLQADEQGLTVRRLTYQPDDAEPLHQEPGDLWPDPVPAPQTLGQLASELHQDGELPARAPAAIVQPRPGAEPDVQPRQTP